MERIYGSISADGLQIPIALMRQYGLEQGSGVVLELQPDGIRIIPAQPGQTTIENRALRYLLSNVGDGVTVKVEALSDETGWQAEVYGSGLNQPAGTLIFSSSGILMPERSTPPTEIRRAVSGATNQP